MTDTAKPAKAKSAAKSKAPPSHPKYNEMIVSAIKSLNQRGGSSKTAIMKYITANYKVGNNTPQINGNIKRALKQGVLKHVLNQPKGTGASGSFQVRKAESKATKVKKPAKVAKKTTKKPKSVKPKTAKTAKSPAKSRVVKPKKAAAKKPKKPMKAKTTVKKTIKAKKPATKKATKK